jgi:hypothetical protein
MKKRKSVKSDLLTSMRPPRPFHAPMSESGSRLASTSKHTPSCDSYSSPCVPQYLEPIQSFGKSQRNSDLQLVFPKENSPTDSLYDASDEEMEAAIREVEGIAGDCDKMREGFRIRGCSSDRNLGNRVKSGRALPPVNSNEGLGKVRNRSSSGVRRHPPLTEDANDPILSSLPVRPHKNPRKSPLSELNLPSQPGNHISGLLPKVFRKRTLSPPTVHKENRLRVTRMLQGVP